jgi:hypothetical protein
MQSTPTPKPTDDPHDSVVVPPDLVRVAAVEQEILQLAQDVARRASVPPTKARSNFAAAPVPPVDATFRPTAVNGAASASRPRPMGRLAARTFTALLLAGCTGLAAMTWQSYGDAAKAMIAEWSPLPLEKLGLSAQATPPSAEAAASDATPVQAATASQAVPDSAAVNADSTQLLQSMARDLASVSQEVVQLKASIEQLKASQQQISRDAAKPPTQNAQARIIAPPPRLPVARPRQPAPTFPPTSAAAAPPPPTAAPYVPRQAEPLPPVAAQPQIAPDGSSVPRPPMPVR